MTPTDVDADRLTAMAERVRRQLLDARVPAGHWEGELSSSPLSTATASFALWRYARHAGTAPANADAAMNLAAAGSRWLASHQNADGGWGDTTKSRSNISTTALCWASLGAAGGDAAAIGQATARATAWLTQAAGSTEPSALSAAISSRYGKDRTFSVPILTMCALAGRFGSGAAAWRQVPQLPFELAAFPHGFFRFLRLPVVSYAMPALIAIGLVRHHHRPARNPLGRAARALARPRVLGVLERLQPPNGGFLEATPLTSFVVMSLLAAGEAAHPVVRRGIEFLLRSARPDGSWPIDTNLATWVTTLSVNALAGAGRLHEHLADDDRARIQRWLLGQQYRQRHPYTGAAPGGWAWTDLPGGVPDADDTAGALIALHHLGDLDDATVSAAASAGVAWLLDLQNRDGGIPTFCRGWGTLPFDTSAPELTAHALQAWSAWRPRVGRALRARIDTATVRALTFLHARQRRDGSWVPLWFGNEAAPDDANPTYGTSRVLLAMSGLQDGSDGTVRRLCRNGLTWLCAAQNADGGWGGARGVKSSIEETAHALQALAACGRKLRDPQLVDHLTRGLHWMSFTTDQYRKLEPTPIGLYFAKLWYFEKLYPWIATTGVLSLAIYVGGPTTTARNL